jgi:hypothetical protein
VNQSQNVAYDSNFRIAQITDSLGAAARFTYHPAGLPLIQVDANITRPATGGLNRRTGGTLPLGQFDQFTTTSKTIRHICHTRTVNYGNTS